MKLELTQKMENWLHQAIANRRFSSTAEAMDYLVALDAPVASDDIETLRQLWDEGLNSGATVDGKQAMADIWHHVESSCQS